MLVIILSLLYLWLVKFYVCVLSLPILSFGMVCYDLILASSESFSQEESVVKIGDRRRRSVKEKGASSIQHPIRDPSLLVAWLLQTVCTLSIYEYCSTYTYVHTYVLVSAVWRDGLVILKILFASLDSTHTVLYLSFAL